MLPSSLLGILATDGHIAFSIWYTHSEPIENIVVVGRSSEKTRERTCICLNSEPEHGKDLFVAAINKMGHLDRILVSGNLLRGIPH